MGYKGSACGPGVGVPETVRTHWWAEVGSEVGGCRVWGFKIKCQSADGQGCFLTWLVMSQESQSWYWPSDGWGQIPAWLTEGLWWSYGWCLPTGGRQGPTHRALGASHWGLRLTLRAGISVWSCIPVPCLLQGLGGPVASFNTLLCKQPLSPLGMWPGLGAVVTQGALGKWACWWVRLSLPR